MKFNRVIVFFFENGCFIKKFYDIDFKDFFWVKNVGNFFLVVVEDIDIDLSKYKMDVVEIMRLIGISDVNDVF